MIRNLLKRHEGFRGHPYKCPAGKLTIGWGRNLDDVGISPEEGEILLDNDIRRATIACELFVPGWDTLDAVRRNVLIDMCFNLGRAGLAKFGRLLSAVKVRDWQWAADEMMNSRWAQQVPVRAAELAEMMRTGKLPQKEML